MKNIKARAPEGATHWCPKTGSYWLIDISGMSYKWVGGEWRSNGTHYPKGMTKICGDIPNAVFWCSVFCLALITWLMS